MASICIINDCQELLAFLESIISEQGHKVICQSSSKNALKTIQKIRPDILMIDVNMPEKDGIVLTEEIRKNQGTKDSYIIICSATYFSRYDVEKAIKKGANDFISLPTDPVSIMTHINMALTNIELSNENKRIREDLEFQRGLIQDLLNNTPDIIYFKNRDGNLLLVNKSHADGHGKDPHEIIGKRDFDLFPYEEAIKMTMDDLYVMETKKPIVDKIEHTTRPNGEKLYVSTTKVPRFDERGRVIGVMGITRNISSRVMVDKKVKEEKRLIEGIINRATTPTFAIDKNHKVLFWNEACERITGIKKRSIIGTDQHWKAFTKKKEPCLSDFIIDGKEKDIKKTGKNIISIDHTPEGYILEKWISDSKGKKRFVRSTAILLKAEDGTLIGAVENFLDITDHKILEDNLQKREKLLTELSLKDPLTGLFNYRYLKERIASELNRAMRHNRSLSLLILDIDYFKSLNEAYGHEEGNKILREFSLFLKNFCRKNDIVVRLGGDEFVLLFPETHLEGLKELAKRLEICVKKQIFDEEKNRIKINISIGAANYPEIFVQSGQELLEIADDALKIAKEAGGGRIEICTHGKFCEIVNFDQDSSINHLKKKISSLEKRVQHTVVEFLLSFAKSLEGEQYYPLHYIENIMQLVEKLGGKLKLDLGAIEDLKCASAICNIGNVGVDTDLLCKKEKLAPEEFEEIKKHPNISAEIIKDVEVLKGAFPAVLYHHERYDGSGYNYGLKGRQIPLCARILAVAEAYQALISVKPYRDAYSSYQAFQIIKKSSGKDFDPAVVRALQAVYTN